jgi:hypothetical protein
MQIFSHSANRAAIHAELALAADFYRRGNTPTSAALPISDPLRWGISELMRSEQSWDRGIREFPFLSTCLLLGVAYDSSTGQCYPAQPQKLGTVFRDDSLAYGMAVVDISNLDAVRYGIVAFCILRVIQPPRQPPRRHTQSMTEYGPPFPEPQRQRKPLSAAEYMSKFDYRHPEPGALERIRRMPLVDETAFECETG